MDRFESILDESISALQAGVPIEEILAETPDYAQELRPLLYAAIVLADPDPTLVAQERKDILREQYLAQAAELSPKTLTFGDKSQAVWHIIQKRFTRQAILNDLITVSITITLTLVMVALILNFAARDSIPGDLLYNVKRISESIQMSFTFDEESQEALKDYFHQERLNEIEQLTRQHRAAVIEFDGILDTKGENLWVIEGVTVFLPEDGLTIQGEPQEGDIVEVVGFLRTDTVLIADRIIILAANSP